MVICPERVTDSFHMVRHDTVDSTIGNASHFCRNVFLVIAVASVTEQMEKERQLLHLENGHFGCRRVVVIVVVVFANHIQYCDHKTEWQSYTDSE